MRLLNDPRWQFGGTALHAAAMRGHADMVEMLVTGGCSIDAKERVRGI